MPPTVTSDAVAGVLGPVVVAGHDAAHVPPRGPRARALVVALALAGGRPVGWRTLVDDLWADEVPGDPRGALQALVSRTRAVAAGHVIASDEVGYRLGGSSDLDVARATLADARRALAAGEASAAVRGARDGLALWRGAPGADVEDVAPDLALALARAADGVRRGLGDVLVDALLASGDAPAAVEVAASAADADPTDEDAHLRLMRAQAAAGRPTEALRTFARLREALVEELGADPRAELVELNARLLAGDASATAAPETPIVPGAARPRERRAIGLRAAPDALLGRDDDVAAVEAALAEARLVTVLGVGGLGKTRLVQEVARRATASTPFVVVVELAGVRTDADVEVALTATLSVASGTRSTRLGDQLTQTADARGRLIERLSETPTLLVLDNCEHVVAGAAAWTDELLAAVPSLRVLTTSRTPLLLAGERVHPLAPLPVDEGRGAAAELFRLRARAARPGAALPDDVVARLAARLDGLPLAIELAAARVRTMAVEEVERRLEARFVLLRSADRSAPERHRTLEAVIDWSWNLLSADEQHLLARLSVLPGGFGLDAAAVVGGVGGADAEWAVLDDVDGLVTQSLVTVVEDRETGAVRYRMLETVREFGQLRLAGSGGLAEARGALVDWATDLAMRLGADLTTPAQVAASHHVGVEEDNLLLALRTALDLGRRGETYTIYALLAAYWNLRGAHEEAFVVGREVLDRTYGWRVEPALVDRTALALFALAGVGIFGEAAMSLRAMARLRVLRRELGDLLGDRTRAIAAVALSRSVPEGARVMAELRRSPDSYLELTGHLLSAQVAENSGRVTVAQRWTARAHEIAVQREDVWATATTASFLAQIASELHQPHEAIRWAREARVGMTALLAGDDLQSVLWLELGSAVSAGELELAERLCDDLARGDVERSTPFQLETASFVAAGRAEIAAVRGDVPTSLERFREAHELLRSELDVPTQASAWFIVLTAGWLDRLALAPLDERGDQPDPREPARTLADHLRGWEALRPEPTVDHPVLGTGVVGIGTVLWAGDDDALVDRGLELLGLAGLLGSRQDLPALHRDALEREARARHGDARVDAAFARARTVGRVRSAARAVEILDEIWPRRP